MYFYNMKTKFEKYKYLEAGKDVWKIKDQCLHRGQWKKIPINFIGKLVAPCWHGLGRRLNINHLVN